MVNFNIKYRVKIQIIKAYTDVFVSPIFVVFAKSSSSEEMKSGPATFNDVQCEYSNIVRQRSISQFDQFPKNNIRCSIQNYNQKTYLK